MRETYRAEGKGWEGIGGAITSGIGSAARATGSAINVALKAAGEQANLTSRFPLSESESKELASLVPTYTKEEVEHLKNTDSPSFQRLYLTRKPGYVSYEQRIERKEINDYHVFYDLCRANMSRCKTFFCDLRSFLEGVAWELSEQTLYKHLYEGKNHAGVPLPKPKDNREDWMSALKFVWLMSNVKLVIRRQEFVERLYGDKQIPEELKHSILATINATKNAYDWSLVGRLIEGVSLLDVGVSPFPLTKEEVDYITQMQYKLNAKDEWLALSEGTSPSFQRLYIRYTPYDERIMTAASGHVYVPYKMRITMLQDQSIGRRRDQQRVFEDLCRTHVSQCKTFFCDLKFFLQGDGVVLRIGVELSAFGLFKHLRESERGEKHPDQTVRLPSNLDEWMHAFHFVWVMCDVKRVHRRYEFVYKLLADKEIGKEVKERMLKVLDETIRYYDWSRPGRLTDQKRTSLLVKYQQLLKNFRMSGLSPFAEVDMRKRMKEIIALNDLILKDLSDSEDFVEQIRSFAKRYAPVLDRLNDLCYDETKVYTATFRKTYDVSKEEEPVKYDRLSGVQFEEAEGGVIARAPNKLPDSCVVPHSKVVKIGKRKNPTTVAQVDYAKQDHVSKDAIEITFEKEEDQRIPQKRTEEFQANLEQCLASNQDFDVFCDIYLCEPVELAKVTPVLFQRRSTSGDRLWHLPPYLGCASGLRGSYNRGLKEWLDKTFLPSWNKADVKHPGARYSFMQHLHSTDRVSPILRHEIACALRENHMMFNWRQKGSLVRNMSGDTIELNMDDMPIQPKERLIETLRVHSSLNASLLQAVRLIDRYDDEQYNESKEIQEYASHLVHELTLHNEHLLRLAQGYDWVLSTKLFDKEVRLNDVIWKRDKERDLETLLELHRNLRSNLQISNWSYNVATPATDGTPSPVSKGDAKKDQNLDLRWGYY